MTDLRGKVSVVGTCVIVCTLVDPIATPAQLSSRVSPPAPLTCNRIISHGLCMSPTRKCQVPGAELGIPTVD